MDIEQLLQRNQNWADGMSETNPEFFPELAKQQTPDILWIGCADSRVPANQILDLLPGDVFVHRNIANMVVHSDLNCLSVIQYAVDVLKVKHVIVCGHYGCGGVQAAMGDESFGLIDNWLRHIKDVSRFNKAELDKLNPNDKHNRLCELNVVEQVANVANTTILKNAWKNGQEIAVHGWVYGLNNGRVKNLNTSIASLDDLAAVNNK